MLPTNSPRFGAERWPCGEGVSGCGGCDANAPLDGTNSPDCERLLFVVVCVSCVCDRVEDFSVCEMRNGQQEIMQEIARATGSGLAGSLDHSYHLHTGDWSSRDLNGDAVVNLIL